MVFMKKDKERTMKRVTDVVFELTLKLCINTAKFKLAD